MWYREIYKNLKMHIIKEEKLEINESLSKSGHWKKGQQHTHKEKEEKNYCRGEIN